MKGDSKYNTWLFCRAICQFVFYFPYLSDVEMSTPAASEAGPSPVTPVSVTTIER